MELRARRSLPASVNVSHAWNGLKTLAKRIPKQSLLIRNLADVDCIVDVENDQEPPLAKKVDLTPKAMHPFIAGYCLEHNWRFVSSRHSQIPQLLITEPQPSREMAVRGRGS